MADRLFGELPPAVGRGALPDGQGGGGAVACQPRRTLQEYRNDRLLPYILLGGKVLYPESGLREVLEANYRKPLR